MRHLVVVRGGDRSLHMQWWCRKEDRSYDIALSYYGNDFEYWKSRCDFFHAFKGSKWEGLADFCTKYSDLISKYDYVWFPDDDIWIHKNDLEKYFEICLKNKFTISQPALMKGSFYSWGITCQNENCIFRNTNFVEVMAPCFRVETFHYFASSFAENTSGWGYEWLWWDLAEQYSIANFAIVDLVPMLHTREVGVAGSGGSKKPPAEEMQDLLLKFHLTASLPQVLSENYRRYQIKKSFWGKKEQIIKEEARMPSYSSGRFL